MKISSKDDLLKMIQLGESTTLELKAKIPSPEYLAKSMLAFQNTAGGYIILGVADKGVIAGVDINAALKTYESAKTLIKPYDISRFETLEIDSKKIGIITIDPEMTRVIGSRINGIIYERTGTSISPISAETIFNKVKRELPENSDEIPHIADLALQIAELNNRLFIAGSWKTKMADMILAGIVGAFISIAISGLLVIMCA